MQSLIAQADDRINGVAKANPQFRGRSALLLQGTLVEDKVGATLPGWRTDFLTQMGFRIPDGINAFAIDDLTYTTSGASTPSPAAVLPMIGGLIAVARRRRNG